MESEEKPKGYTVRDRRRFTEEGEVREEAETAEAVEEPAPGKAESDREAPARESPPEPPGEISLGTFLVSLSTQALVLLGEIPNPATGETETDLRGVQELISLIAMLQEKTRGNVDPSEKQLFDKILYDLRLRYVEKVRR